MVSSADGEAPECVKASISKLKFLIGAPNGYLLNALQRLGTINEQ
jgi:hypothetical protein